MQRDEFDFEINNKKISGMIKKAKRKHLFRNLLISIICTIVTLFALFSIVVHLRERTFSRMEREVEALHTITGPNVKFYGRTKTSLSSLITGSVMYSSYKNINGLPVKWIDTMYEYSIFGNYYEVSPYGNVILGEEKTEYNYMLPMPEYNAQTLQKEMSFYLPFATYPFYQNDFKMLEKLQNKSAELAISFDKAYSVSEVKEMLPKDVRLMWYWVDTYGKAEKSLPERKREYTIQQSNGQIVKESKTFQEINAEKASEVLGFMEKNYGNKEEQFLSALKLLAHGKDIKSTIYDAYDNLKGNKKEPRVNDLRILGVVVTGTSENLLKLQKEPYVRTVVLGATVDNY